MKVAHLPLRTKLLAALVIPIIGMLVLGVFQVQRLLAVASVADEQLNEVDNSVAIAQVARAIGSERDVQLTIAGNTTSGVNPGQGTSGADGFFARVRETTDEKIGDILSDDTLSSETRAVIQEAQSQLGEARLAVGDDLGQVKVDLIEDMTSAEGSGDTMDALVTFDDLVGETINLIDADTDRLLDAETSLDLTTLELAVRFDEAVRLEALAYLEIALIEPDERPAFLVAEARRRGGATTQAELWLTELSSPQFSPAFDELLNSSRYQDLVRLRNEVASAEAAEIEVTPSQVLNSLLDINTRIGQVNDDVIAGARQNAIDAQEAAQRALLIGGALTAALAALVALAAVSFFRSIRRPLLALTTRSREIADVELPGVVTLLREEGVDAEVPEIVPIEAQTNDEVGELVVAFNDMHRTAVELASEQAASRRTVSDMFVNLGRRNQRLLIRILAYLDTLEREEEDPASLEKLFKVDHLVTRMRRNAESLLVLAGAQTARVFKEPVPVSEVARSALAEVEGYERVHLDVRGDDLLDGTAVADTAHLLAELIENSLNFSPPDAPVIVIATKTEEGYFVAVADRGIGMSAEDLANANDRIAEAGSLTETPSSYLGHHVVGTLAARHNMTVTLGDGNDDVGVTAKIAIPAELLSQPGDQTTDLDDVLDQVVDEVSTVHGEAGDASSASFDDHEGVERTDEEAAAAAAIAESEARAEAVSKSLGALSAFSSSGPPAKRDDKAEDQVDAPDEHEAVEVESDHQAPAAVDPADETAEDKQSREDEASALVGGLLKRRKIPKDPDAPPALAKRADATPSELRRVDDPAPATPPVAGPTNAGSPDAGPPVADEPPVAPGLVRREKGASLPAGISPTPAVSPEDIPQRLRPVSEDDLAVDPADRAEEHRSFANSLSGFQTATRGPDAGEIQRWYANAEARDPNHMSPKKLDRRANQNTDNHTGDTP